MSDQFVTVTGPHGRHIEVLKSTQEALPEAFPLADPPANSRAKRSTAKKPNPKPTHTPTAAPVEGEQGAPDSSATADETSTVETTKEAR